MIDGRADNAARIARLRNPGLLYYPYVERTPDDDKGLFEALAELACVIVTDDYPCFFLPRMVKAASKRLSVRMEKVDSNGLLPYRATEQVYPTAYAFRRFLQRNLPDHLPAAPAARPLARLRLPRLDALPAAIRRRWPAANESLLAAEPSALARLPIDHSVGPAPFAGASHEASLALRRFVRARLSTYAEDRNHPVLPEVEVIPLDFSMIKRS